MVTAAVAIASRNGSREPSSRPVVAAATASATAAASPTSAHAGGIAGTERHERRGNRKEYGAAGAGPGGPEPLGQAEHACPPVGLDVGDDVEEVGAHPEECTGGQHPPVRCGVTRNPGRGRLQQRETIA